MAIIDDNTYSLIRKDDFSIKQILVYTSSQAQDQTQYRATAIGSVTDRIEVDINCPSGIYHLSDEGSYQNISVRYEIALKKLGADKWTCYKYEIEGRTPDEIGFTHKFEVSEGVYDVCIYRLTSKSQESTTVDKIFCNGLKSVVAKPVKYDDVTVILMRITGDKVLSEMNENQLSTIWKRKLPNIYTEEMENTSALAPAVKYIIKQSKYPDILDDAALRLFNQRWQYKGLNLNGVLDKDNTLLDVLKDVLNVGFSEPIVKGDKLSFTEQGRRNSNELDYIFQPQNITESPNLTITLPKRDDVHEVVAEYMNPDTWKTDQIYVHAADNAGNTEVTVYPTSIYQEKISLFGVTSKVQAVAMASRRLNYLKFTTYSIELKTELEGLNVSYNDFVGLYIDQFINSEKTGRVIAYDKIQKTILLTNVTELNALEKATLVVRDSSGSPHIVNVTDTELISDETGKNYLKCYLEHDLPFTWSKFYGSKYEYPYFVAGSYKLLLCWVQNVQNSGNTCTVKLTNYDSRIFQEDIYIQAGWGHCPWGHCPWGHSGMVTGNGWGHGSWGHSVWGHGNS